MLRQGPKMKLQGEIVKDLAAWPLNNSSSFSNPRLEAKICA
jgi:hypothetical protein